MDITFTKVKLPYGWLGNMAPYPLMWRDEPWKTPEALFQALRFEDPKGDELGVLRAKVREGIRLQSSPMAAKMLAKKHADLMTVVPRSPQDVENMEGLLMLKLAQHSKLIDDLLAIPEDVTIIEDCTARQNESGLFWGAAHQEDGSWKGRNELGKTWMRLATFLRTKGRMSE